MITLNDIEIGSEILVRGAFGSGPKVKAEVTGMEPNGKNGEDVVSYETADGDRRWCYLDQIDKVL